MSDLEEYLEKYSITKNELDRILKADPKTRSRTAQIRFSRKHFKFGYITDLHVGHEKFKDERLLKAIKYFKREGVDFVTDCGDHVEGMSGRHGHIYELTDIGFSQQMNHLVELYEQIPVPIYGIDGNHDGWYKKKNNGGVIVGQELEGRLRNYTHLGESEGDLLVKGVRIKMFHANDGTAYAMSYKLQKLIESFSGGEKPNIVLSGHYHKAFYMFLRNVHGFECGTLCGQTEWMRGKKIQAHIGFGVVDVFCDKIGVERVTHTFVAEYEEEKYYGKSRSI